MKWWKLFCDLAEAYHWTFEEIGRLTFSQAVIALRRPKRDRLGGSFTSVPQYKAYEARREAAKQKFVESHGQVYR